MINTKVKYLTSIGLVTGLLILTTITIGLKGERKIEVLNKPHPPQALGAETQAKLYSLTLESAKIGVVDSTMLTKRVTVTITVHNDADRVLLITPGLQMFVTDQSGVGFAMTAKYLTDGQVVGGPLEQGDTQTYSIDFELPADSNPKIFRFDPGGGFQMTETRV